MSLSTSVEKPLTRSYQPPGPELPKSLFAKEGFQGVGNLNHTPKPSVRLRRIIPAQLVLVKTGPVLADAGKRESSCRVGRAERNPPALTAHSLSTPWFPHSWGARKENLGTPQTPAKGLCPSAYSLGELEAGGCFWTPGRKHPVPLFQRLLKSFLRRSGVVSS